MNAPTPARRDPPPRPAQQAWAERQDRDALREKTMENATARLQLRLAEWQRARMRRTRP